jgi:hypothetical protein
MSYHQFTARGVHALPPYALDLPPRPTLVPYGPRAATFPPHPLYGMGSYYDFTARGVHTLPPYYLEIPPRPTLIPYGPRSASFPPNALYGASGFGAAISGGAYGTMVADAVNAVAADKVLASNVSPFSRITVNTIGGAAEHATGVKMPEIVGKLGGNALDAAMSAAIDAVGQIAGAVPLMGTMISFAKDVLTQLATSKSDTTASDNCSKWERDALVVTGWGGGGKIMPADYFHPRFSGGEPSAIALYLLMITESRDARVAYKPGTFIPPDSLHTAAARSVLVTHANKYGSPKSVGDIPPDRMAKLRKVRQAIQAQYKTGDGGVALWPLYLDMILYEIDVAKTLTDPFRWTLWNRYASKDPKTKRLVVREGGCFSYWNATARTAEKLLSDWRKTTHPVYAQDKKAMADAEVQAAAALKALLAKGAPGKRARVKVAGKPAAPAPWGAAAPKPLMTVKQDLVGKAPAKIPPAAAAAGAGALLWFLFL